MNTLLEILNLKRPHGGRNEVYIGQHLMSQMPMEFETSYNDKGQVMAYIYTTDEESNTLFVAHLDTVHNDEAAVNPVQYDQELGIMYKTDGTALGADDGAGVWLLFEMMKAGVKGTFMYTVGEERGGVGARWVADNCSGFMREFDRAIAFDRAGTKDVITHQGWGRCCSDDFAQALSDKLNVSGFEYRPDDTGVYTDTAEWVALIPECTNISCGYASQHSGNETQDVDFLFTLRDVCLELDWDSLPVSRDPAVEDKWTSWRNETSHEIMSFDDIMRMDDEDIYDYVYQNPDAVAEMLIDTKGGGGSYEVAAQDKAWSWFYGEEMK